MIPEIFIPAQFAGTTLGTMAAEVSRVWPSGGYPSQLRLNFSHLNFIRPAGVTFLSNLIYWLAGNGCRVELTGLERRTSAIAFLDDSLFFEQHCGEKRQAFAAPRTTTRPLLRLSQQACHGWLDAHFVPWIAQRSGKTNASYSGLRVCLSELFNNIADHANLPNGSIFCQHFPNEKRVIISVSDFGPGIPETVRRVAPGLGDDDAVIRAVQDSFTSQSLPTNRGAGLWLLLQTVVSLLGGAVTIYSLGSIIRFEKSGTGIYPNRLSIGGWSPGTTVEIDVRTDQIESLPDQREALEW